MKRSEMINYLAKIIRTSGSVDLYNPLNEHELAEDVLSAIEKQGMLPPYRAVGAFEANFTWEPEDEKK